MDIDKLYQCFLTSAGISTDTRRIESGQMFFALSGENFNGNKFAKSALEKGASYVIVDENLDFESASIIKVKDSLLALQQLATHHRNELKTTIIAITGSNGKTTTKELLYQVLASQYECHFTKGNLNNHIGVPLTILALEAKHELGIIEMGANHVGEIKDLCNIAQPDFGLITNIGKAHLEGFGSLDGIIKGKSEMYDYLKANQGIIFYNGEDEVLEKQIDGYQEGYKYFPSALIPLNTESNWLSFKWEEHEVVTNLSGLYNLFNIAVAIFIGQYFKVSDVNIVSSISEYVPTNNRSQILVKDGVEYFLDAYNANPSSMQLSLENFFGIKADVKVLVLGDMLELGKDSVDEHKAILNYVCQNEFERALLVGNEFKKVSNIKDERVKLFDDVNTLKEYIEHHPIEEGSKVLLKASRGIGLEKMIS